MSEFNIIVTDRLCKLPPATYRIDRNERFEAEMLALSQYINEHKIERPAAGQSLSQFLSRFLVA